MLIHCFLPNDRIVEIQLTEQKSQPINLLFHQLEEWVQQNKNITFNCSKNEWKQFLQEEKNVISAAGGIVENESKEILFIFRRNKWDLPKGKIEPNESIEDAAIREVKEETGLQKLNIINPLPTTYHLYKERNQQWIIKQTHWFLMQSNSQQILTPQAEEDITKIEWCNATQQTEKLKNSYPLIIALLNKI